MNETTLLTQKETENSSQNGLRLSTPLGEMLLVSTGQALSHALFAHQIPQHNVGWHAAPEDSILQKAAYQISQYFQGLQKKFTVPLSPQGSYFDKKVWSALENISFGTSSTYGELAQTLCQPKAARAVGAACGRNPIAILIPCHRVIGKNRRLVGYAGGLERKNSLLQLEGVL